jgi:hypothetical protein
MSIRFVQPESESDSSLRLNTSTEDQSIRFYETNRKKVEDS